MKMPTLNQPHNPSVLLRLSEDQAWQLHQAAYHPYPILPHKPCLQFTNQNGPQVHRSKLPAVVVSGEKTVRITKKTGFCRIFQG
jgi:hypothetical protein